jgi:EmrB/QacA subfamily drug resistance transporter
MHDQPIDYSRKWYAMAAVAMGVFLATIDGSIVIVAQPTLEKQLQTDFATVQWVVLAYLLTVTTLLLSVGRLADMIGKKPIYTSGVVVFTVGSALCGLAPTISWLIAFRVLQAVGAAMTMGLGAAIITESFPPQERGKALGIIGSVVSVGIVVGPVIGGILMDALSWHWIFFVNIPVGIVGFFMSLKFLPHLKPPGGQRFDFPGAITLFVSLISLLLALTIGQKIGFTAPAVLVLLVVWFVFLGIFIGIELRTSQPMVDLRLFRNQTLSINLTTALITFILIAGTTYLMPFYLENILNYEQQQVGLLMAVVPIMLGITSPISGVLSDRFGTRPITVIGLAVLVVGYYGLTMLDAHTTAWLYILLFMPIGAGMGIFQSPNNSAIMGAAPRTQLGVASGLLAISRVLGQTVGTALIGALWASRVFDHVGQRLEGGATTAPPTAQVAGLHDTFFLIPILIIIALALGLWAWFGERRSAAQTGQEAAL